MKNYILLFVLSAVITLTSCTENTYITNNTAKDTLTPEEMEAMYLAAIEDCKVAEPYELSRNLVPIVYLDSLAGNGNLKWRTEGGERRVLVVSYMSGTYLQGYIESMKRGSVDTSGSWDSWVTVVPELQDFFKFNKYEDSEVHLRVNQLLGMRGTSANKYFVEMWVKPEDLYRPTPDAEITDNEAQLDFPLNTSESHKNWVKQQMQTKYYGTSNQLFPWTRMGYTYDWGNKYSKVGLSEFVLKPKSSYQVKNVDSLPNYLK